MNSCKSTPACWVSKFSRSAVTSTMSCWVAETSQQLDSLAEQQESLVKRFRLSA